MGSRAQEAELSMPGARQQDRSVRGFQGDEFGEFVLAKDAHLVLRGQPRRD